MQAAGVPEEKNRTEAFNVIMKSLPSERYGFMAYICKFMADIVAHADVNLMHSTNVAKIFSSLLLGSIEKDTKAVKIAMDPMVLLQESNEITSITKTLIEHVSTIFSGLARAPKIFKAVDPWNSPSYEYISLLRGDIIIILQEKTNSSLVMVNHRVSELPKYALKELKSIKLVHLKVKEISVILQENMKARSLAGTVRAGQTEIPRSRSITQSLDSTPILL